MSRRQQRHRGPTGVHRGRVTDRRRTPTVIVLAPSLREDDPPDVRERTIRRRLVALGGPGACPCGSTLERVYTDTAGIVHVVVGHEDDRPARDPRPTP